MLHRIRCLAAIPVAVGFVVVGLTGPAAAAPKWQPIPVSDTTITGVCPFNIYQHAIHYDERVTTTTQSDGTIVSNVRGVAIFSLTNLSDTSKTQVVNESGPATTTYNPLTTVYTFDGRGTSGFFTGGVAGFPPFLIVTGHLQYTAVGGNLTSYSLNGPPAVDECAALS